MLTILPTPVFFMSSAACWQQKKVAFRFTLWMKSQSASVISSGSRRWNRAALLTSPYSVPTALLDVAKHAPDVVHFFEIGPEQLRLSRTPRRSHAPLFPKCRSESPPDNLRRATPTRSRGRCAWPHPSPAPDQTHASCRTVIESRKSRSIPYPNPAHLEPRSSLAAPLPRAAE